MNIIATTGADSPWLWLWTDAADWPGRSELHCIPIIAWAIDGETVLPITAAGRAEPGGAWAIASGDGANLRYVTSSGELVRNQSVVMAWLKERFSREWY